MAEAVFDELRSSLDALDAPVSQGGEAAPREPDVLDQALTAHKVENDRAQVERAMTHSWATEAQKLAAQRALDYAKHIGALEDPDSDLSPEALQANVGAAKKSHDEAAALQDAVQQYEWNRIGQGLKQIDPLKIPEGEPSTLSEMGKAVAGAPIQVTGRSISGAGRAAEGLGQRADLYWRNQLDVMDRIDAGKVVPGLQDLFGYGHTAPGSPERAQLRQYVESQIAQQPTPGTATLGAAGKAIRENVGSPIEEFAKSQFPLDPRLADTFLVKAAGMAGGFVPYMVVGALTGVTGATAMIAADSYEATFQQAKEKGVSDQEAHEAAGISALTNAGLMTVPVSRWVGGLPEYFKGTMVRMIAGLAGEGVVLTSTLEAQKLLDNVIAKTHYDPNRPLSEGIGRDIPEELLVGALMPGGMHAISAMRARTAKPGEAAKPEEAAAPTPEEAKAAEHQSLQDQIDLDRSYLSTLETIRTPEAEEKRAAIQERLDEAEKKLNENLGRESEEQAAPGGGPSSSEAPAAAAGHRLENLNETEQTIVRYINEAADKAAAGDAAGADTVTYLAERLAAREGRSINDYMAAAGYARRAQEQAAAQPNAGIEQVPDSVFSHFPDMKEAANGLLPLNGFTQVERDALQRAGLIESRELPDGSTAPGVDPQKLWTERDRRKQAQTAPAATPQRFPAFVERMRSLEESEPKPGTPEAERLDRITEENLPGFHADLEDFYQRNGINWDLTDQDVFAVARHMAKGLSADEALERYAAEKHQEEAAKRPAEETAQEPTGQRAPGGQQSEAGGAGTEPGGAPAERGGLQDVGGSREGPARAVEAGRAGATERGAGREEGKATTEQRGAATGGSGAVTFTTAKGSTYQVHEDGTTSRNKALRNEPGHEGDQGPKARSERTFYVTKDDANKLGEIQGQGGGARAIEVRGNHAAIKYLDGKDAGKFERRTVVPIQDKPAVGLLPVELWKGGSRVHFGNEITEVRHGVTPEEHKRAAELFSRFDDVLARDVPRNQWAHELGVDPGQMKVLIDEGLANGQLRLDDNGIVRRGAVQPTPPVLAPAVKAERMARGREAQVERVVSPVARQYAQRVIEAQSKAKAERVREATVAPEEVDSLVDMWRFVQEMRSAKTPEGLTSWLVRHGGVVDEKGDIRAMLGAANRRPGLISGKGRTLDDAALRAWEEGFLPSAERPTINDLLEALDRDLRGDLVIAEADSARLEEIRAAREMENVLAQLGLSNARDEAQLRAGIEANNRRALAGEGFEGADDSAASVVREEIAADQSLTLQDRADINAIVASNNAGPLEVPPADRIAYRVRQLEAQTGKPVSEDVRMFAERIEAARGTDSFDGVFNEIKKLKKADVLDLANLVGYPPKKTTTKAGALASIEMRHKEQQKFLERQAQEADAAQEGVELAAFAEVGRSQKRDLDKLGFYSALREAAEKLPPKGTPAQMLATLRNMPGVKEAEIRATGLDKFLAGNTGGEEGRTAGPANRSISRQEIIRHLEENRVEVRESNYGGQGDHYRFKDSEDEPVTHVYTRDGLHVADISPQGDGSFLVQRARLGSADPWTVTSDLVAPDMEAAKALFKPTKWSSYSLDPSNPTYRETVIHLGMPQRQQEIQARLRESNRRQGEIARELDRLGVPARQAGEPVTPEHHPLHQEWAALRREDNDLMREQQQNYPEFRQGHFSEPNVIAHARTSLQKDGQGKAVFLVDELQSDWGQKLRDGGARDEAKIAELSKQLKETNAEIERLQPLAVEDAKKIDQRGVDREFIIRDWGVESTNGLAYGLKDWAVDGRDIGANAKAFVTAFERRQLLEAELQTAHASVPGHPLVSTTDQWTTTAFRRLIRQAVEAGADRIAISPGRVQVNDRGFGEDVVRGVTSLAYDPTGKKLMYGTDRGSFGEIAVADEKALRREIDNDVLVDRLLKSPEDEVFRLEGLPPMTVGGGGMKYAYDQMYPKTLSKLLSKIDPSVKMEDVPLKSSMDGRTFEHKLDHGLSSDVNPGDFFTPEEVAKLKKKSPGEILFHSFPLTPKIKASVLNEGQALFSFSSPRSQKPLEEREAEARKEMETEKWKAATVRDKSRDTSRNKEGLPPYLSDEWKATRQYANGIKGWDSAVDYLTKQALAQPVHDGYGTPQRDRRAFIVIGYPGSGKSTVANLIRDEYGAPHLSPDDAKPIIPEYDGGKNANGVQTESRDLNLAVAERLAENGTNFIIEAVGTNDGVAKLSDALHGDGYNVSLIHVDTPKGIAMERAVARYKQDGRPVPLDVFDKLKAGDVYAKAKTEGKADETATIKWDEASQSWQTVEASPGLEGLGRGVDSGLVGRDRGIASTAPVGKEPQGGGGLAPEDLDRNGFPRGSGKQGLFSFGDHQPTPAFEEAWPALAAEIEREARRILPSEVATVATDRLFQGQHELRGRATPAIRLVEIALADQTREEALRTLIHEGGVHMLREMGLYTDKEWALLLERAKKVGVEERITSPEEGRPALDVYRDFYSGQGQHERVIEELLNQERVAQLAEEWVSGTNYGTKINSLLERMWNFIEAIKNVLKGHGFQTVDDVFQRVLSGEVARRAEGGRREPTFAPLQEAASFGGVKAASNLAKQGIPAAEKAIALAERMEKSGSDRDAIWSATAKLLKKQAPFLIGVYRDKTDGKWRVEIDDSDAVISNAAEAAIGWKGAADHPEAPPGLSDQHGQRGFSGSVREGFVHHGLAKAAPELRERPYTLREGKEEGFRAPDGLWVSGSTGNARRSITLHELQHELQTLEGFFNGKFTLGDILKNDPEYAAKARASGKALREWLAHVPDQDTFRDIFRDLLFPRSFRKRLEEKQAARDRYDAATSAREAAFGPAYERAPSEQEARLVETRRDMTADDRRASPPWATPALSSRELRGSAPSTLQRIGDFARAYAVGAPPPVPARFEFKKDKNLNWYTTKIGPHELTVSYDGGLTPRRAYDVEFTIDHMNDDAGVDPKYWAPIFHAIRQNMDDFIAKNRPRELMFEAAGGDPAKTKAWAVMGEALAKRHGGTFRRVPGDMLVTLPERPQSVTTDINAQIAEARAAASAMGEEGRFAGAADQSISRPESSSPKLLASFKGGGKSSDLDRALDHASDALGILVPTSPGKKGKGKVDPRQRILTVANEGGKSLLNNLGDELRPLATEHATELSAYSYPNEPDPVSDGFRQFFRDYISRPEDAKAQAPEFFAAFNDFLDAHAPDLLRSFETMQQASQDRRQARQGAARERAITLAAQAGAGGAGGGATPPPGPPGGAGPTPPGVPPPRKLPMPALIRRSMDSYIRNFQPELVSDKALQADPLFARYRAASAQEKDAIVHQAEEMYQRWAKVPEADQLEYIRKVELGERQPTDELNGMAFRHRRMLDMAFRQEALYGSKAAYIEEYFPHIWEDPAAAREFFQALASAKNLGPKWFQKVREIELIEQGLQYGLKLKTSNPEELITLRLLAGVDMRQRMELLQQLQRMGLVVKVKDNPDAASLPRAGWTALNAPNMEQYLISPDVAALWKNAVEAKGLWQAENAAGSIFRGWMALKNVWVPLKLTLSLFHPLHVVHINMANGLTRGWNQLVRGGDVMGALKSAADAFNPVYQRQGVDARAAWLKPATERTPEENALVKVMTDGGFSPQLSEQLKIKARRDLADAWGKADWLKILPHGLRRGIEMIQGPLFERWIPHLKAAAYIKEAQALFERRPDLLDDDIQRRIALRAIAKSVDNRFGEMFYSTLFWNRTIKDAGIGSFLSLGWNLGFVREFGGGTMEAATRRLYTGTASRQTIRDATNKTAFALIYMSTAMAILGAMNYGFTGDMPEGMDFIFPRIGGFNPDGSPRRITNMFYSREIPMAAKHIQEQGGGVGGTVRGLGDMLWNKMMFTPFWEMLSNRDYWGYQIYSTGAPLYKQAWQFTKHLFADNLSPITASGAKRAAELGGSYTDKGVPLAFLGFGPAPAYAERTATQNRINHLFQEFVAPQAKPEEQREIDAEKRRVRDAIRLANQRGDSAAAQTARQEGQAAGLKASQMRVYKDPASYYQFKRLPESAQAEVLSNAPAAEFEAYRKLAKPKVKAQFPLH